jgi:aryl-alcohol dehydrogenase-like predicted oxidoreductase
VVKAGKARYIGASSMHAWQFAKALYLADRHGWTRFVSMQPELNLLYREEEREMLPLCREEGIGVIPWSPIARGRLARPGGQVTNRQATDEVGKQLFDKSEAVDAEVIRAVEAVAKARGVPMAQVALAWVLQTPGVTAPIVGASKAAQMDDALAALALRLSDDERAAIEAAYRPHAIVGFD